MRGFYLLIICSLLFSCKNRCGDGCYELYEITFIVRNESEKVVYLQKYKEDAITTDTIKNNSQLSFTFLNHIAILPNFVYESDSIILNFENEKYRIDSPEKFDGIKTFYNTNSYVQLNQFTSIYTITQTDFDNATPF